MIELDHVTKKFGGKTAVDDLSLAIPKGELFAFLGPNGAGKTTAIKMIAGLLRPTRGTVRINGADINDQPLAAKRMLGYVPDQPYLYDKLSGREFMRFIRDMYGMSGEALEAETTRLIDLFGMSGYVDELTETYSHGMKQRLVLAATLLHQPAVLVLDEPMVGLDPQSMRLVKDLLRRLAQGGITVLMSTHLLAVAEECADRIAIINHGRVAALGTPAEIRARDGRGETMEQFFLRICAGDGG
ncbi:MAG: ABC transporter ATP-binding protein [Planctomycetes bacterium]|nr:ABC transporter ATP-binding protein [Planctomycetota bacterium]